MTTTSSPPSTGPDPVLAEHVDESGRRFGFATVTHPDAVGLGIHFSAFLINGPRANTGPVSIRTPLWVSSHGR